jgi:hypothetical protein
MELRRRVGPIQERPSGRGSAPTRERIPFPSSRPYGWRLSAAAAAFLVLLGVYLSSQWRNPEMVSAEVVQAAPQENIPVADLFLAPLRGESKETVIRMPRGAPSFMLLVHNPEPFDSWSGYDIVICDFQTGEEIWKSREPQPDSSGTFNLSIPRGFLPAGRYFLRLQGRDNSRSRLFGERPFTVEYE